MKSIFQLITLLCLSVMASMMESCSTKNEKIVLAYVTSHGATLPDPDLVTHINYAFAHVDSTFSKLKIDNEGRLSEITALKQKAPHLKVLLSVGGWESGRFSEMAANEQYRLSFANDCRRAIEQFQLDGIDIDWEYPTSSAAGISSSPDDTQNYTLLMRDLRKAIGPDKLLTLASVYNGNYIDFKAIDPYIDFVNVMVYDINRPPYHHAALYRSPLVGDGCGEEAVEAHIQKEVPVEKLVFLSTDIRLLHCLSLSVTMQSWRSKTTKPAGTRLQKSLTLLIKMESWFVRMRIHLPLQPNVLLSSRKG